MSYITNSWTKQFFLFSTWVWVISVFFTASNQLGIVVIVIVVAIIFVVVAVVVVAVAFVYFWGYFGIV